MIGHPYFTWTNGGAAPPPTPPVAEPQIKVVGGGRITRRKKRKEDEIQEVIQQVALRQVETLELDEQKRFEELERELQLRNVEWESRYLELLNQKREMLIIEELKTLLKKDLKRKEEDDSIVMILMTLIS